MLTIEMNITKRLAARQLVLRALFRIFERKVTDTPFLIAVGVNEYIAREKVIAVFIAQPGGKDLCTCKASFNQAIAKLAIGVANSMLLQRLLAMPTLIDLIGLSIAAVIKYEGIVLGRCFHDCLLAIRRLNNSTWR